MYALNQMEQVFIDQAQGKKIKYNINIPMKGMLKEYCIQLNQKLDQTFQSDVIFGNDSIQYPHITLHMGYVENFEALKEVAKIVEATIQTSLKKGTMEFQSPIQKSGHFTFLDIIDGNFMIDCKRKMDQALKGKIIPFEFNMVEEPPHITLAYTMENKSKQEVQQVLDQQPTPPIGFFDEVAISFCGDRGSCLGSLKIFELE